MRIQLALAAVIAAAAVVAVPAFGKPATIPYQVDVTITNNSCVLDHPVAPQKFILFHVISNGTYSHQFKIYGLTSGIIKSAHEGRFGVRFRGPGAYTYTCWNSHAFLKRGVFRIK